MNGYFGMSKPGYDVSCFDTIYFVLHNNCVDRTSGMRLFCVIITNENTALPVFVCKCLFDMGMEKYGCVWIVNLWEVLSIDFLIFFFNYALFIVFII